MESTRRVYGILLLLVALWCSLIVLAPVLHSVSEPAKPFATLVYKFFSRICHQLDDRSFHLGGEKFAVCIRCSTIYFAFLAGLVLYPLTRRLFKRSIPPLGWLVGASLPMLVDVFLNVTGIHSSDDVTRGFTGSLFGIILPLYILPVLFESIASLSEPSKGEPFYARKTE